MTKKFDILNRFTAEVQLTAEIDCADNAAESLKLGLAVKWAVKNKADLSEANLRGADLYGADLSEANLRKADLFRAYMFGANLNGADLRRAHLRGANLRRASLFKTNLLRANITEAHLSVANMREADLSESNLFGANLSNAYLSRANLRRTNLHQANLRGAHLSEANLRGADLSGSDLREADLREAHLFGARNIEDRIIDGGLRSDGYRFLLTRTEPGPWRVKTHCHNFSLQEAQAYWDKRRPEGTPLDDETQLILNHMVALAKLRQWPETGEDRHSNGDQ